MLLNENKDLKNVLFFMPNGLKKYLKNILSNYNGDKTVDGYKRLNNLIDSDSISYSEMKRLKHFFDNYIGSTKNIVYVLNGGEFMKNWVNMTLTKARDNVYKSKSLKRDLGIKNSFKKTHKKTNLKGNNGKKNIIVNENQINSIRYLL